MPILKVARMGHPVLRAKARTVDKSEIKNAAVQQFIDSMIDTMYEYSGVGLAAPQVHESLRIFVAMLDADGRGEGDALAFINPEITIVGSETVEGWEGCLSIPDIRGRVPRAQYIKVSAFDRTAKRFELDLKDFPARVVQHETDHLDGVLFFDRMKRFESLTYLEEYSRYHTRQDDDDGE
ncbi:MAG TPA: peptide deformylase [Vicinamibacterales bacterium]|nr:peptide deformylase [Vicinamibacterales bacterium]